MPVTVGASHEPVTGADDVCDAIEAVLVDAEDLVEEVSAAAALDLRDMLRQQARQHSRWAGAAEHIEMWPDEDGYNFGVRDEAAGEAFAAEYGDENNAPVPVMRMGLSSAVAPMGWSMTEAFQEAGY